MQTRRPQDWLEGRNAQAIRARRDRADRDSGADASRCDGRLWPRPALPSTTAAAIALIVITPHRGDVAGAGGVFNVDLALVGRNAKGNGELSAANGYMPGRNGPTLTTFGVGEPDPFARGLVVLLSTT